MRKAVARGRDDGAPRGDGARDRPLERVGGTRAQRGAPVRVGAPVFRVVDERVAAGIAVRRPRDLVVDGLFVGDRAAHAEVDDVGSGLDGEADRRDDALLVEALVRADGRQQQGGCRSDGVDQQGHRRAVGGAGLGVGVEQMRLGGEDGEGPVEPGVDDGDPAPLPEAPHLVRERDGLPERAEPGAVEPVGVAVVAGEDQPRRVDAARAGTGLERQLASARLVHGCPQPMKLPNVPP